MLCDDCGKPLTGCWSKGKFKTYPYRLCPTKGCASYRKSIPGEQLETEFAEIVRSLQPTEGLFKIAEAMFRDAWDQRLAQAADIAVGLKRKVSAIDTQIERLLDRVVDATSASVVSAYEKRIEKLEREKLQAAEDQYVKRMHWRRERNRDPTFSGFRRSGSFV